MVRRWDVLLAHHLPLFFCPPVKFCCCFLHSLHLIMSSSPLVLHLLTFLSFSFSEVLAPGLPAYFSTAVSIQANDPAKCQLDLLILVLFSPLHLTTPSTHSPGPWHPKVLCLLNRPFQHSNLPHRLSVSPSCLLKPYCSHLVNYSYI